MLVIAYGNPLRGDDGAGPRLAAAIERQRFAGVEVIHSHQLTPELAAPISQADAVVFIDAALRAAVRTQRIIPDACSRIGAHTFEPIVLLGMAKGLFGNCPPSWLILLPAANFEFREALSVHAENGLARGMKAFARLWRQHKLGRESSMGSAPQRRG